MRDDLLMTMTDAPLPTSTTTPLTRAMNAAILTIESLIADTIDPDRDPHPDFIARDLRDAINNYSPDSRLIELARYTLLQLDTIIDELDL